MQMDVHKTLYPFYSTKKMVHGTTIKKINFVGSNSQAYYDNLHKRLSADFQSRALLFKEALPRCLTKPQIVTLFYLTRLVIAT